jgi:hypothetical protein
MIKTPKIRKSKNTKNNRKTKKVKDQVYYTLGQGRKPFLVKINNNIEVYKQSSNGKYEDLVLKTKFISYMLGKCIFKTCDHPHGELGNTILVKLKGTRYLYIGESAYEFDIDEDILEYGSPVGNNDTPYPYARTTNKTILFIENRVIDNKILSQYSFNEKDKANDDPKDPYYYYYAKFENDFNKQRKIMKENEKQSKMINVLKKY